MRLVVAQAGRLPQARLRAWQLAAEDVAELPESVGLAVLLAAEDRPEDLAQAAGAGMVAPERAQQRLGALRLRGVAAHRPEDHRQCGGHRPRRLRLPGAELAGDLLQGRARKLGEQVVGQAGHGVFLGVGRGPEPPR